MKSIRVFSIVTLIFFILQGCTQPAAKHPMREKNSFTFAFLTDIHVSREHHADLGFRKAIDTVNKLNPDFVITGGDLVSDALGQRESRADSLYDLYIELSHLFNMPVYNTMGNHEVFGIYKSSGVDPSNPLFGEKMYEARMGKSYYAFDYKGWRFYILNSVEVTPEREYIGKIDEAQVNWIREDLKNVNSKTPIVISVHIPFITIQNQLLVGSTAANGPWDVITNSREVLDLFKDYNLKLVLQGHMHFLEDDYAIGTHFITGGAVSADWWNGPLNGMEEGFLLLKVKGEDFSWEYIDFGWDASVMQ
jgi:Icc protein